MLKETVHNYCRQGLENVNERPLLNDIITFSKHDNK